METVGFDPQPGLPRRWTIADVMTTQVHVASELTPFKLLVRLIDENRISAVPIVDRAGIPVGIVSEADLLLKERRLDIEADANLLHLRRRRKNLAKAEGLVARDLMTAPPISIHTDTTLTEAARVMQKRNVRRLVVVDGRGRIAGVVSRSDLLQVFLRADHEIRHEIVERLIPALMLNSEPAVEVEVRYNVVTLGGEVDRRTDAEILGRLVRDMDGVVDVVNKLTYRWDDTGPVPLMPTAGLVV